MSDRLFMIVTIGCALGCGLNGGVFFAFSSFVMKALARLPAGQGIAAMNSINVFAVTPAFMTALFGTAAACLVVMAWTWFTPGRLAAVYLLSGSAVYLVGTIGVTVVFNVPRNNALAALHPSSAEANRLWAEYVAAWTSWNHVRTVSALIAAALLAIGACVSGAKAGI